MINLTKKSIKGKNIILYIEEKLDDFLVSSSLNLVSDTSDTEIEKFISLKNKLSENYIVSLRLCTLNVIEYEKV